MTGFPIYLLIFLVFLNRYFGGLWLKQVKGARFDETIEGYEPTVTVVIPLFNEGEGIYQTLQSLLEQDYPADKLDVIVVDDCSTDDSYAWAKRAEARDAAPRAARSRTRTTWASAAGSTTPSATRRAEIIVSVDSDVIVETNAVRQLVARFTARDRRRRRAGLRLESARELAHPDADHQVLLRVRVPEEPRAVLLAA